MRNWQGTRRVYFKEMFYEIGGQPAFPILSPFPTRNWVLNYGTNSTWNIQDLHPVSLIAYNPWNSNFHMGNVLGHSFSGVYESCTTTNTGVKLDSTDQPYTDPFTGDGGLEPVIYEFASILLGAGNDLAFCFYYTLATDTGYYVRRILPDPFDGTETIELGTVVNTAAPPIFTPLATFPVPDADPTTGKAWRFIRIYYSPSDQKYGGSLISSAGRFDIWMADGEGTDLPKNYMEGLPPVSARTHAQYVGTFTHGTPILSGDSLALIAGPDAIAAFAYIKYCRHWDYGLNSIRKNGRMTWGASTLDLSLTKATEEEAETSANGQIGYELGDRIELQVKSKQLSYADPPVEVAYNSICDFDGIVTEIKQSQGTGDFGTRLNIEATDGYGQFLKWAETISFAPAVTLETAFKTMTGQTANGKYAMSAMNGYGIDPALSAVTFAGTNNYIGLRNSEVIRRLNVFAKTWCYWIPEGTLVATKTFPSDASWVMDTQNPTINDYIINWQVIQDGLRMINNMDIHDGTGAVNRNDSALFDRYLPGGFNYIDTRVTTVADKNTIGDNLVSAWKNKRRIIDVTTYQGLGWIREGDEVSVTIDGLHGPTDYQVIEKQVFWGEKYPTRTNQFKFRLCEKITGEPSIFRYDLQRNSIEYWRRGTNAEAQWA